MDWNTILNLRLRNAPTPIKALALSYVIALSLAYIYALGNIALVVGLTPKAIAIHYYGAETKITEKATSSGEQELNLDAVETEKKDELGPRPSFKNLVAEGHFHLFGMTSFFFGLTVLGLFTSLSVRAKTWAVTIPYVTVILDNISFMITRFGGPQFAYFTAIAGTLMGFSFLILWIAIFNELIKGSAHK